MAELDYRIFFFFFFASTYERVASRPAVNLEILYGKLESQYGIAELRSPTPFISIGGHYI